MRGVILDADSLGYNDDSSEKHNEPWVSLEPVTQLLDEWRIYGSTKPEEVSERINKAEVVLVNKVKLHKSALASASNLKLISVMATGTDNIDLAAAGTQGIRVCNAVNYATPSVVEHTIALMLTLCRNLMPYVNDVKNGAWQKSSSFCLLDHPMTELNGKTLGIIGFGALGQGVAQVAEALGMRTMIAERTSATRVRKGRHKLARVLEEADVISLHCPLNKSTLNLIDASALSLMKSTAFLINTARGGLVDSLALIDALKSGQLAGAAIDVLATEPPTQSELLLKENIANLIVTPHNAWAALESRNRLIQQMRENILGHLDNKPLRVVK